jgi:hypothetical protein
MDVCNDAAWTRLKREGSVLGLLVGTCSLQYLGRLEGNGALSVGAFAIWAVVAASHLIARSEAGPGLAAGALALLARAVVASTGVVPTSPYGLAAFLSLTCLSLILYVARNRFGGNASVLTALTVAAVV